MQRAIQRPHACLAGALAILLGLPVLAHAVEFVQQGPKLLGNGTVGGAQLGASVALSADGNTAIVGGNHDNNSVGAAWVFIRSNGVWAQQGAKLVGSGVA